MSGVETDEVVAERLAAPREDESLLLAVGHGGCEDEVVQRVEGDLGGTVEAVLPFETVRITLPETALSDLCGMDCVETVETEREVRLHDEGN